MEYKRIRESTTHQYDVLFCVCRTLSYVLKYTWSFAFDSSVWLYCELRESGNDKKYDKRIDSIQTQLKRQQVNHANYFTTVVSVFSHFKARSVIVRKILAKKIISFFKSKLSLVYFVFFWIVWLSSIFQKRNTSNRRKEHIEIGTTTFIAQNQSKVQFFPTANQKNGSGSKFYKICGVLFQLFVCSKLKFYFQKSRSTEWFMKIFPICR